MRTFIISATILALIILGSGVAAASGIVERDTDGYHRYDSLNGFDYVDNRTSAALIVLPNEDWRVRVSGDSDDIERLEIDVEGETLVIRRKWRLFDWGRRGNLTIEVGMPGLRGLRVSGSGDAEIRGEVRSNEFELRTTGSGEISAGGTVGDLEITATGSGAIRFEGRAETADVELTGSGGALLSLETGALELRATGSGDIRIKGSARDTVLTLTGSGGVDGGDFETERVTARITGSGSAELGVTRELETRLTGSGSFYYYGNPNMLDGKTTGSGRVVRREN